MKSVNFVQWHSIKNVTFIQWLLIKNVRLTYWLGEKCKLCSVIFDQTWTLNGTPHRCETNELNRTQTSHIIDAYFYGALLHFACLTTTSLVQTLCIIINLNQIWLNALLLFNLNKSCKASGVPLLTIINRKDFDECFVMKKKIRLE